MSDTCLDKSWRGDPSYHRRHHIRSVKRARRIAFHNKNIERFLDVGCNEGLVSEYLLKSGKVKKAVGVELSDASLSSSLNKCPDFTLLKGDIVDLEFEDQFDCIFYGAVHHHIVREHGFHTALSVFKKLVAVCKGKIYFETGQLTEGSRWLWQRKLNALFSNDEEHFNCLLRAIEPSLSGVKVVGRFRIHGIRRYLLELTVNRAELEISGLDYFLPEEVANIEPLRKKDNDAKSLASMPERPEYFGPTFGRLDTGAGELFLKYRPEMEHVDYMEYLVGRSVSADWALKPLGYSAHGIVFPWFQGTSIFEALEFNGVNYKSIEKQLDKIVEEVFNLTVDTPASLFFESNQNIVVDIVDFNGSNFLYDSKSGLLKVCDFEVFSSSNRARNLRTFSSIYFRLRSYRKATSLAFRALKLGIIGLRSSSDPFEVRVLRRTPSIWSWLFVKGRSRLERIVCGIFPFFKEM